MKVLVVDDELPILEAVAYNLRKEGYETVTATMLNSAGAGAVGVPEPYLFWT